MNAYAIVLRTRELLASPAHWTRDYVAVDSLGAPINDPDVDVRDPRAVAWCVLGGVCRTAGAKHGGDGLGGVHHSAELRRVIDVLDNIAQERGYENITALNDDRRSTTHATILEVLDGALAELA